MDIVWDDKDVKQMQADCLCQWIGPFQMVEEIVKICIKFTNYQDNMWYSGYV